MPLFRGGWRRRIEVFSPKLGRRLNLGSYDAFRAWLVIEANPAIQSFTERPTHCEGPGSPVIERGPYPYAQCLSKAVETHSSKAVAYCLQDWVRSGRLRARSDN